MISGDWIQEHKLLLLISFGSTLVGFPLTFFFALNHVLMVLHFPEDFTLLPSPSMLFPFVVFLPLLFIVVILISLPLIIFGREPRCIPGKASGQIPQCSIKGTSAFPGKKDKTIRDWENQPRYPPVG